MKTITSILALLALGTTFAGAADETKTTATDKPTAATEKASKPDAATKPDAGTEKAKTEAGDKPKRDPEVAFKKLDTNSDGKLSSEEWSNSPMAKKDAAKATEMFGKKDKDGDKSLTLEEFSAHGGKKKD